MLVSGGMCLFIGMYPHFLVDLSPRFIVRVSLSAFHYPPIFNILRQKSNNKIPSTLIIMKSRLILI